MKCFAVHSYKGGTGKTVISANLAAYYAAQGYRVCLLDFDFRAPSLASLFPQYTSRCTNELLEGYCDIQDVIVKYLHPAINGELWIGLSDPGVDSICAMVEKTTQWQVQALKNILNAKKQLEASNIDIAILDVTPGIEQIALNSMVAADCILTVLKPDQYGIEGTKRLIKFVYNKLNQEVLLIENKCFEEVHESIENARVIASIHCMCDLSKYGDKKIFTLDEPAHPFSLEVAKLAQRLSTR
jgi:septum site-determining protein MinD